MADVLCHKQFLLPGMRNSWHYLMFLEAKVTNTWFLPSRSLYVWCRRIENRPISTVSCNADYSRTLHTSSHMTFSHLLRGSQVAVHLVTDKKTGQVSCPKWHGYQDAEMGYACKSAGSHSLSSINLVLEANLF